MAATDSKSPVSPIQTSGKKPRRRRKKYLIAIGILGLLGIVGIISIFTFAYFEGNKAERDWTEFQSRWEKRGEIFDLDELIPPDIPKEENFAASPIIAELFDPHTHSRLTRLNPELISEFKSPAGSSSVLKIALNAPKSSLSSFIQEPESYSSDRDSAKAILEILKPLAPLIDELEKASRLPAAKFPLHYENSIAMVFQHLKPFTQAAKLLALRSRAHLSLGDSNAATNDLLTIITIAHLTGSEPSLVSRLLEINLHQLALIVIWQGLNDHHFEASDLKKLDHSLSNHEITLRVVKTLRTERASFIVFMNQATQHANQLRSNSSSIKTLLHSMKPLGLSKAYWIRNKLNYSSFIQKHGLLTDNEINWGDIDLATAANIARDTATLRQHPVLPFNPYAMMASMAIPPCDLMIQKATYATARIDLCRTAIALDLYHRDEGNYPKTLSPLSPDYIDALPLDLVTGKPLHYYVKDGGTPIIYSVGLNKIDEDGLLRRRQTSGDWVWQYTLPDDFDETSWRE